MANKRLVQITKSDLNALETGNTAIAIGDPPTAYLYLAKKSSGLSEVIVGVSTILTISDKELEWLKAGQDVFNDKIILRPV